MSDFHDWANSKNVGMNDKIRQGKYPYEWDRDVHNPDFEKLKESGLNITREGTGDILQGQDETVIRKKKIDDTSHLYENLPEVERIVKKQQCKRCNRMYEEVYFSGSADLPVGGKDGFCSFCVDKRDICRRCSNKTIGSDHYYLCEACYEDKGRCPRCDKFLLRIGDGHTTNLCEDCQQQLLQIRLRY